MLFLTHAAVVQVRLHQLDSRQDTLNMRLAKVLYAIGTSILSKKTVLDNSIAISLPSPVFVCRDKGWPEESYDQFDQF